MSSAREEPLSSEERELARRLAQLGAPGGPPAALDAQILTAAQAALSGQSPRRARRPRRWPMALGAVATLALAVGVAWQLRPRPERAQAYSEAPAAAPVRTLPRSGPDAAAEPPAAEVSAVDAPQADSAQAADPSPPAAPAVAAAEAKSKPTPSADRAAAEAEQAQAAPQAPERRAARPAAEGAPAPPAPPADIVFEQTAAAEAEAASSIPAPAPATGADASAGAARVRREATGEANKLTQQASDALDQIIVTDTRSERVDEAPHEAARAQARDNAGYSDHEIDDQPPATADSPLVQKAWLQRIRELIANGKQDEARDSLAEFKRRYPRYALPEDLHGLLP